MGVDDIYLSKEGHDKLRKELEFLKSKQRQKLSKAIEEARLHGDLSENAEYDAAKEAQAMNEKKIVELENNLSRAQIIDDTYIPKDKISIGATVKLQDLEREEEIVYTLVSGIEADFSQGKISVASPVGKALLGHKVDEVIEVNVPAGILKYKILDISR